MKWGNEINSDYVGLLTCPSCSTPVSHSFRFREEIKRKCKELEDLTDSFFAHSMKMSERKRILSENSKSDEIRKLLKDSKSQISSTQLSMLEIQYKLQLILSNTGMVKLTRILMQQKRISVDMVKSVVNVLKAKGFDEAVREIERIPIFSFQSGLWRKCSKCCEFYQFNCYKCL